MIKTNYHHYLIYVPLAMVLNVYGANQDPIITYDHNKTKQTINPSGFTWDTLRLNDFYQPLINQQKILAEELKLKFDTTKSEVATTITDNKITITGDGSIAQGSDTIFSLKTVDKGLAINNGKGALSFDFAPTSSSSDWNVAENGINHKRKMMATLYGTTQYQSQKMGSKRKVSLVGNLNVYAGRAHKQFGENYFEATFYGDLVGNISINSEKYSFRDLQSIFTFGNNASIFGNITTYAGKSSLSDLEKNFFEFKGVDHQIYGSILTIGSKNHFDFSNSGSTTIIGDITTNPDTHENSANTTIVFSSSSTNTIQGNIKTKSYAHLGATNEIIFKAGSNTIIGNITAEWHGNGKSTNTIKAEKKSQSLTIEGTISAHAGKENILLLESGNNTLQNQGKAVLESDAGTNKVTFKGENATIAGNIYACVTKAKQTSSNIIVFSSSQNVINGDINATPYYEVIGKNDIVFTSGSATIMGNITTHWNGAGDAVSNTITVKDTSSNLIIDGIITANSGKNIINLLAGNNELKNSKGGDSLVASWGINEVSARENTTLTISGTILAKTTTNWIQSEAINNHFKKINNTGGTNIFLLSGGGG